MLKYKYDKHTWEPMALLQRNCACPKMCLILSMIELVLDDAEQKVEPRSPQGMYHKYVSVRKRLIISLKKALSSN